jgi:hypothetical protein
MPTFGAFENDAVGFHAHHDNYGEEALIGLCVGFVANSLLPVRRQTEPFSGLFGAIFRKPTPDISRDSGGAGRNRTADKGSADLCLTTWRPRLRM